MQLAKPSVEHKTGIFIDFYVMLWEPGKNYNKAVYFISYLLILEF